MFMILNNYPFVNINEFYLIFYIFGPKSHKLNYHEWQLKPHPFFIKINVVSTSEGLAHVYTALYIFIPI